VIRFVDVRVGEGDAVACSRCGATPVGAAFRPTADVVAQIVAAVESWSGGAGPNVALGGADALGHPELPVLVAAAMEAGVARLRLDTDGAALQSPRNAAGSVAAGVRHVRVTILAGTPGVHDALAGGPGRLDALGAGVRTFLDAAAEQDAEVCVTAVVPVCRHNARDVPSAVAHAARIGCASTTLLVTDAGLDLAGARASITAACDTGVVNGMWVEVDGAPFCAMRGWDLHVADTVRERAGAKAPACAECALDGVCGGGPAEASAEMLAGFAAPADAAAMAGRVARARGSS
jgi:hypothetical protein